nr:unnamed protein product [Digitaria exilis]
MDDGDQSSSHCSGIAGSHEARSKSDGRYAPCPHSARAARFRVMPRPLRRWQPGCGATAAYYIPTDHLASTQQSSVEFEPTTT